MSNSLADNSPGQHPFRNEDAKPDWARLTRLGGDRVAILFEDLRTRISVIPGLIEDLYFCGPEVGWTPRYRVGDRVLFTVQVLPGNLTAIVELDELLSRNFLNTRKVAARVKEWLRTGSNREGKALLRVRLKSRADICSLGNFIIMISKEQV